ncbi:MAG TPA: glycoside hydrolase family 2 TIM barrel-domain containing protein [Chitinophagaceae bacterium]|nr:glycoside hydrolase family 2 TIM barrel-domain containing protein [Chitinophagaceae bacterium]
MKRLFFYTVFLLVCSIVSAQVRTVIDFNKDWKFFLGDDSTAMQSGFSDAKWRKLNLPHDWSIESNFTKDAPATNQGGSLPGGIGWYRKTFTLPESAREKKVNIEFDGVYKNSEVWINGHYLGKRPYGYINFSYDLTPWLFFGKQNVIAVKVDNSLQPDSRWYTGSGIYRDVKLIIHNRTFIDGGGLFITTIGIDGLTATIEIAATIKSITREPGPVKLLLAVYNQQGKRTGKTDTVSLSFKDGIASVSVKREIEKYYLWSSSFPFMYTLRAEVILNGRQEDAIDTKFGLRTFHFDAQKGFFLNNQPLKIHGVCLHHDLGALGAAFNKEAARRQLKILKEMGCNAIRFSHNPPASPMLDLCDEMGFLVVDEAFDIWKKKKNKYDYHQYFDEWAVKDVQDMVYRDRNHPSIIMWSIGNEQREQFDSSGTVLVKKLVEAITTVDISRPVTTALTETFAEKNFISQANALDVLGFNYKLYDYEALPQRFPGQKFIATETASALETRGVYQFPSDSIRIWPPDYKAQDTFAHGNKDFTCAAYDNTHAYWGATHEKSWLAVKKNSHIAGLFVWSGFDYLGEPLPYPKFPSRSSYYGIVDLAGFPKDVYYMYQSEWTNKPVLHVFPHWNWKQSDTVDVWAYYNNADAAELYVNGKSAGKRQKTDSTLHVMWRVPYKAGAIKVITKRNEKPVLTKEIKTAGQAARIELIAGKSVLKADGKDLCFVTARITDRSGNLVPDANNQVIFSLKGAATIAGTDNGYQADTVSLKSPVRNCWKGLALAIIQSGEKKGNITLTAKSPGLKPVSISLKVN